MVACGWVWGREVICVGMSAMKAVGEGLSREVCVEQEGEEGFPSTLCHVREKQHACVA